MKKKKQTKWQNFKWELFMVKVKWWNFCAVQRNKRNKRKHCDKGFHNYSYEKCYASYMKEVKGIPKIYDRLQWIRYKCNTCGDSIFFNDTQKKRYLQQQVRINKAIKQMIEDGQKKRSKKNPKQKR